MKRTEAKNVGQIIDDLLKKENLDVALDEHRACALWPQIVGDGINRYTIKRYVKDGVMTVHLSSASLANELMLNRDLYSRAVSAVRQPIESFFNWLNEKTSIQRAHYVRSTDGLVVHVMGSIAIAFTYLIFNC